jgi:Ser/Thr protein kinase RdoA (MazF antagonist)
MDIDTKQVEKIWDLKNVVCEKIFSKNEHRLTALIDSSDGKFVYKVASPWKDETALKKDTAIFDILNNLGKSYISQIRKTNEGEDFASTAGRFVCLFEYVDGENPAPSVETFSKLGEIVADLHSVKDYPYQTDFDPSYISKHNFIENAKAFSFADEYLKISDTLPDFGRFSRSLIHTDISPKNSIEAEDGSIVLIDWDDVGIGPTVLDLGYILGHFVTEELEVRADLADAFFKSYFSKRTITPTDRRGIFDGCLFFHLMYIIYGDVAKRWTKIKWLVENRELVESLIP